MCGFIQAHMRHETCVCVLIQAHTRHETSVDIKGQFSGLGSLLLPTKARFFLFLLCDP